MPRSLRAARTARLPRARTSESRCGTQTSANSLTLALTGAVWKLDAKQQANRAATGSSGASAERVRGDLTQGKQA